MRTISIGTAEYKIDLKKMLERRLVSLGERMKLDFLNKEEFIVYAIVKDNAQLGMWVDAVVQLILCDIAHFEIAALLNALPLTLIQKQYALPQAISYAVSFAQDEQVRELLTEHFRDNDHLNIEGFLHFRLHDVLTCWALSVDCAIQKLALAQDYMEYIGQGDREDYADFFPGRVEELCVIINPDGTCTITDELDTRIDCQSGSVDGIMRLILGLSPKQIAVYDFTGGGDSSLGDMLKHVFCGRISFYCSFMHK